MIAQSAKNKSKGSDPLLLFLSVWIKRLDKLCFLKSLKCAVFGDSAETLG